MADTSRGKGKLAANLDRVPKGGGDAASGRARAQEGVELITDKKWEAGDGSEPADRVRLVDWDANRVLFSGTTQEYRALKRAIDEAEE